MDVFELESMDGFPEDVAKRFQEELFERVNGKWVHKPRGYVEGSLHDEVKAKAAKRQQEVEKLQAKLAENDPEEVEKLRSDLRAAQDRLEAGEHDEKIAELVEKRLQRERAEMQAARKKLDERIQELEAENQRSEAEIANLMINAEARRLAPGRGVFPDALEFVEIKAERTWQVERGEDGKRRIVPRDEPLVGKDGRSLDMAGWIDSLKSEHPSLFESRTSGSGGAPNTGGSGGAKTKSRADFEALGPAAKMKFVTEEGGTVVD